MKLDKTVTTPAAVALSVALWMGACGGGGGYTSPTPPSPSPVPTTPTVGATVTITANGVSDAAPRINVGQRIRFTNSDTRTHQILSTPHGPHTDCPALNSIGTLAPGQSGESGALNERRGCGWHDHMNPDNNSLRGQVLVGIGAGDPTPPPPDY